MTDPKIAVVGATGAVGREMIDTLIQRGLPTDDLTLLASSRSAGQEMEVAGKNVIVKELKKDSFKGIDIALFSAGGAISKEFAPYAEKEGTIVIDNSSAFRMDEDKLLIVPEVNGDLLRKKLQKMQRKQGLIIANPNCSTIQLVVVLKAIEDAVGLKRVVLSTYQSVSGAGQNGMEELNNQVKQIYSQNEIEIKKFPYQIAFNCIPQIDEFLENGYTKEEMKLVNESRKILSLPKLPITTTAVRVPVFSCHSESVNVETIKPLSPEECKKVLREAPGIIILDDPANQIYPMNFELVGTDATYVGRIRKDESVENGLNMWVVADNLRKGAALNAVQITEIVLNEKFPVGKENLQAHI